MNKTILITGATDGIGLETAKMFANDNHKLLLHGRSLEKLHNTKDLLLKINQNLDIELYIADFSILSDVYKMTDTILRSTDNLDVIINNAGVFVVPDNQIITQNGLDVRFCVNTIAPYILTKNLMPILNKNSRVINLSSAAQCPINFELLNSNRNVLSHDEAYAQSKLAVIMWSIEMAQNNPIGATVISVNPKSFLGSKMVKTAYGRKGFDLKIGADILYRASLSDEFANANGKYYDNDYCVFANPHPFALDKNNRIKLMEFLNKF